MPLTAFCGERLLYNIKGIVKLTKNKGANPSKKQK